MLFDLVEDAAEQRNLMPQELLHRLQMLAVAVGSAVPVVDDPVVRWFQHVCEESRRTYLSDSNLATWRRFHDQLAREFLESTELGEPEELSRFRDISNCIVNLSNS